MEKMISKRIRTNETVKVHNMIAINDYRLASYILKDSDGDSKAKYNFYDKNGEIIK